MRFERRIDEMRRTVASRGLLKRSAGPEKIRAGLKSTYPVILHRKSRMDEGVYFLHLFHSAAIGEIRESSSVRLDGAETFAGSDSPPSRGREFRRRGRFI